MKKWIFLFLSCLISMAEIGILGQLSASQDTGKILGRVSLNTPPPALPEVVADKTLHICGDTVTDPVLIVEEGGIKGAVIWIDWKGEPNTTGKPPAPVSLKSQNCLFHPRIQATQVGAFLHLNSGDETAHNPHGWWNNEKTVFNITLLNPNLKFKRKLRWTGTYRVECDTHTWMKSYIWVFQHPFFAVTDEKGNFTLKDVPVGTHTLHVWHEILGEQTATVVVTLGKQTPQSFEFALADHRRETLKPKTVSPWPPIQHNSSESGD